jgi:hypothetical protein
MRTRILLILAAAVVLRGVSFQANRYVLGDVNHFVSVTETFGREFSLSLDYRSNIYQANAQPLGPGYREVYSQHQPLWMVLGGLIYRVTGRGDAYTVLKGLSLACGLLLLCLLLVPARGSPRMFLTLGFCAVSIAAVDFSANGSFYSLLALLYLGFFLALGRAEAAVSGWRWGLAAGVLGILALLTHLISAALIAAVPVYLLLSRPRNRGPVLLAGGVMLGGLAAYEIAWRLLVDAPANPSLVNFLVGNGFAARSVDAEALRFVVTPTLSASGLPRLLGNAVSGMTHTFRTALVVTGPLVVFLVSGLYAAVRRRREPDIGLCLAVLAGHLLIVAVFPFGRLRFIVPVLPFVFLTAALGVGQWRAWTERARLSRRAAGAVPALIALFAVYNLFYLVRFPHTYYDGSRPRTVRTYLEMEDAARWLAANAECGNVLGYTRLLDGGREAVRFHHCPFVAARAFLPYPELAPRFVERYRIAYVWTDTTVREDQAYLRNLPVLYEGPRFVILRAPGA